MKLIAIGKIVTTFGNKGEVRVKSLTDFEERFKNLKTVYLQGSEPFKKIVKIEGVRYIKNFIAIKFEGINSLAEAEKLKGFFLKISEKDLVKLPKDSFYIYKILNLPVYDEEGERLGEIKEVLKTGSNDVYVIRGKREFLIPVIKDVVKKVDLKNKKIIIKLMDGLI